MDKKQKKFAKECHKKHLKLWDIVIKRLPTICNKPISADRISYIKHNIIKLEFGVEIFNDCFGCKIADLGKYMSTCDNCLFDNGDYVINNASEDCLSGFWEKFYESLEGGKKNKKRSILLARRIRNFPLKKEYEYEGCYDK